MPNYRRHRVLGGSYFFTVNLLNRRAKLLTNHIDVLLTAIEAVRQKHPFHTDAFVILPDHLHTIWTLPPDDDDYSTRWRQIKSAFSRDLPNAEPRSVSRQSKQERGIWQRRFWEHTLRDEQDFANHADYIHYNPVKHRLVPRTIDWPHSSFHEYVKRGTLPPDWGAGGIGFDADWE